jgi:hypothetical protein
MWRKYKSLSSVAAPNSPHILNFNKFKSDDAGLYVCKTTNESKSLVEIGLKFKMDEQGNITAQSLDEEELMIELLASHSVPKLNTTSTISTMNETKYLEDEYTLPNINIRFSNKIEMSRGERVEMICETGT